VKDRQALRWDEQPDAAGGTGGALDEAGAFEGKDHLMDGGRGDAEEALQVGLGGWSGMDAGIGVDERQVLPLLGREAGVRVRL
jgi:hypothetical protein